jgi:hypothetical protein
MLCQQVKLLKLHGTLTPLVTPCPLPLVTPSSRHLLHQLQHDIHMIHVSTQTRILLLLLQLLLAD